MLNNVNFTVERGDRLALLGRNGAGKTTLIKLIGGVEMPTSGKVHRTMTVSWPLGFAGGFQGSLTGYDNARFIARIYGRDYKEMRDFIEDFTELGRQLRMPVKTYSSGMRARLAFGLSLAIEFDCYLIDEIILVGDQNFQRKCHHELFEKRSDRTMILASHSNDAVRQYCNKALLLSNGHAELQTDVEQALAVYSQF
ncbi:capsular polysaccharide transport system ATP-binding protein [Novosphingobium sp. BK486]|nr:capsular polysaccharide transport system ATP-binding protein [Novosphingobium sp. BK256]MBB3372891.1 capsular polysaccharide transport system ATP-binding protein [Novosphingobium sp. BK280]MBB3377259.1 capsular polysaccharide transport system ATP-binding protein [Novosphingobium sp. BK258]MBB3419330.1 capsular polysaccharide transport system ATP-binding protein [Novosphingobium sp. BK267]MBB3448853.1 capsular polysaccharide transport system ATP-binding protein [Novosphingobium sp. BK352]MBB